MPDGRLFVRVFDGAREPFDREVLLTVFDSDQRIVHRENHRTAFIDFSLPASEGPKNIYRIVVSADGHCDAGQIDLHVQQGIIHLVDLMLLPRSSGFLFGALDSMQTVHNNFVPLMRDFLTGKNLTPDQTGFAALQKQNSDGLATLLSISCGFEGFGGAQPASPTSAAMNSHPLDFIAALQDLRPDRFFAEVKPGMLDWLSSDGDMFKHAPHGLHPGSFISFKEQRYSEGNVQFTFSRIEQSLNLIVDADIDLFKDQISHFFVEIVPSDVLNLEDHTDPRAAYALRWMSAQRLKSQSGVDFKPPYSVVPA